MTDDPPTPSIRQFAAARSLLGWTQAQLAQHAHVAVSTVSDFERGAREPISNNLLAMQKALEKGGVLFISGGVVLAPAAKLESKPAAQLRFARAERGTFDEMRSAVWRTPLARIGDAILVWVNQGDILGMQMAGYAKDLTRSENV